MNVTRIALLGFVLVQAACGGGALETAQAPASTSVPISSGAGLFGRAGTQALGCALSRDCPKPSANGSYSVPTDLATVTYPASYTTSTGAAADSDPCKLEYTSVTYPQSWLGNYALPAITGAPFPANFSGGMSLKDIALPNNPTANFQQGCSGDLKAEHDRTIARLVKLNVKYVQIPQWHWIVVNADGSWSVEPADANPWSMPDANLAYFVAAAHKAGLKVIMANQIQGINDAKHNLNYVPASTPSNYALWFDAYFRYIAERAPVFQTMGIDIWEVGCSSCVFNNVGTGSDTDLAYFAAQNTQILAAMRKSFTGKLLAYMNPWLPANATVMAAVDYLDFGIYDVAYGQVNATNASSFSAAMTKALFLSSASPLNYPHNFDGLGKTLIFEATLQSRANAFTLPGYLEEVGCVAEFQNLNLSTSGCLERETAPDFALQAIFFEGLFEALKAANFKSQVIPLAMNYWNTDSMVSDTVFPNLASSIRNKPAEGVYKAWFSR